MIWPIRPARSIRMPTTDVGAHCDDAALVFDIAVYHLTGSAGDIPAALGAFRRAAGPLLERTRSL